MSEKDVSSTTYSIVVKHADDFDDKIVTESEHDRALRDELTAANSLTILEGQKRVLAKRRTTVELPQ